MSFVNKIIVSGDVFTFIGEQKEFTVEIPLRGWDQVDAVIINDTGATGTKFFDVEFAFTNDGLNYTDFADIGTIPSPLLIPLKSDFIIKFRVTRAGTDGTGILTLDDITVEGNFEQVNFDVLDLIGTPFEEIVWDDVRWNQTWLNLLEKLYKEGIIPEYINRRQGANVPADIVADEDYIVFWKIVAYFWAYVIEFGERKIGELLLSSDLLRDYLKQKSFLVCDEETLADLAYVTQFMMDEMRQRGTFQIKEEKLTSAEVSTFILPAFASATDRDYMVVSTQNGDKYAVYLDKTGASIAPTGLDYGLVPVANKVKADISGDTTAADVAATVEAAFNSLTGFTTEITTDDTTADGYLIFTQNTVGKTRNSFVRTLDDTGTSNIEVILNTEGVDKKVHGELLRYVCYQNQDEFLFEHLPRHLSGWNVNNTSPIFEGCTWKTQFNKAPENTVDIIDRTKYTLIEPSAGDVQRIVDGSNTVFEMLGNISGATVPSGIEYNVKVDPYFSYEITFLCKVDTVATPALSVEVEAFEGVSPVDLVAIDTFVVDNQFVFQAELPNNSLYYFVRCIIYDINHAIITGADAQLNIQQGNNLKFNTVDTDNINVKILNNSNIDLRVFDVKMKPLIYGKNSSYINSYNIINAAFVRNRNSAVSVIEFEENVRRYLIAYGEIYQAIYSPKSNFNTPAYLLQETGDKILQETGDGILLE